MTCPQILKIFRDLKVFAIIKGCHIFTNQIPTYSCIVLASLASHNKPPHNFWVLKTSSHAVAGINSQINTDGGWLDDITASSRLFYLQLVAALIETMQKGNSLYFVFNINLIEDGHKQVQVMWCWWSANIRHKYLHFLCKLSAVKLIMIECNLFKVHKLLGKPSKKK